MAVWRTEVTEMPSSQDLAVWNHLVQAHEDFARISTEFLTGNIDRVALIRYALRSGHGKHTAIYALQSLRQTELQELFVELVTYASSAHGAIGAIREAILSLPRDWVLDRLEAVAEPLLVGGTYDEYRRLLELYQLLDPVLTQNLAMRAVQHPDPDIQEAGMDFLNQRD